MSEVVGQVILVGAGPGDPDLLTLKALKAINSADVVAYDKLISKEILDLIPENAEKIVVGRRGGKNSPASPDIHPLVIEKAKSGKNVVRLKCGDSFIFGRGGEESLALLNNGIKFQIIPGVTAASGASAASLVPLTHRKISSDVTFATAHRVNNSDEGSDLANLVDWNSLPKRGTIVLYMVAHHLKDNLSRIVSNGRDPLTPCAFISEATTPRQQVFFGNLKNLASIVKSHDQKHAALVIIGDVVDIGIKLNNEKELR